MRLRLEGILLFAFIPLVLWLYLRQPIGPGWSVALGVSIMLSHRFLAAPWMLRRATGRCLWCGGAGPLTERVRVASGRRTLELAACGPEHRDLCGRFLSFAARYRAPIALGIFAPLGLLLLGSAALALGRPFISHDALAAQFRIVVAATVAGASVAYRLAPPPAGDLRCPFPLHNLFLLGIRNTLWVFRIVGAWWLAGGVLAVAGTLLRA